MSAGDALLIVGQGLAGSLIGWECERLGRPFQVIDPGHDRAASRVGAGLINPLTGRRLAPVWRVAEWRDRALAVYRAIEQTLGTRLVTDLRIRRRYRDPEERLRLEPRLEEPDVARWIDRHDADGLWIRGGVQVDTARLIAALRQRWQARGWLRERRVEAGSMDALGDEGCAAVVWCVGAAEGPPAFSHVPWERSKGELLAGRLPGLAPGVLLHDGHWLLPGPGETARVGATYDRSSLDLRPTVSARVQLEAAARRLGGTALVVERHEVGCRVTTPDRRPVAGWSTPDQRVGLLGGLGSKGALWAPVLAQQWVQALGGAGTLDPLVEVRRFARR